MIILHNLFEFSLPTSELINIYILYIRSVLESSAVIGHSSITKTEEIQIERVQKTALKIILADEYEDYPSALSITSLQTLSERRKILCKKFAKNCLKIEKMCHFSPNESKSCKHQKSGKVLCTLSINCKISKVRNSLHAAFTK